MKKLFKLLLCFFIFLFPLIPANGKDLKQLYPYQFLSYDKIPTWSGVVSDWNQATPQLNLYNKNIYKGHADFVSMGLKRGIDFRKFKDKVKYFATREYLPLMLYDLSQHPLEIDGISYTWAIKLVDYGFEDTPAQMNQTCLRLMDFVANFLSQDPRFSQKGILILSLNPKIQSPTALAPLLKSKGYAQKNIYELIRLSKGPRFKIMNTGTGVGYLRYIPAGEENSFLPSPQDIPIFEKLPLRIPPVAGIITLEPQTELAHVNLLAKNRGTFNFFTTELDTIPGLKAKIGQLVKIECWSEKVSVTEIDLAEAKKVWQKNQNKKVEIPEANLSLHRLVFLGNHDAEFQQVNYIGAKAANYALIQKNFPQYVRPGFALPFKTYFDVLEASGAQKLIAAFLKEKNKLNLVEREAKLQAIQNQIMLAQVPAKTLIQIRELQTHHFRNARIRLRSSTNCEDLPEFNGAGLYLSKGLDPTDSNQKLNKKILQVYASLWSPLAFEEREFYQIDHHKAGMALLIHEAFPQEYANGVVLTIPHAKGAQILINSQIGDNLITNPEAGQIPESLAFDNFDVYYYRIESTSSLGNVFVDQTQLSPLLWELKVITVKADALLKNKLAPEVRNRYGIDIEFKIIKNGEQFKLYIKQLRLLGSRGLT